MKRCTFAGWLLFFAATMPILAEAEDPAVIGKPAPELRVSKWLQTPDGFNGHWSHMRGKVIVLEFWATWCSPCVSAISHMNRLAKEFKSQGVLFLAIADDDEERLKTFLAKQRMEAIIGIDTERVTWRSYGVPSIPHALLIDRSGRILGATLPENITAETLKEALAGGTPSLPPKEGVASDLDWDLYLIEWQDGVPPLQYAIIKPIITTTSGAMVAPTRMTADGAPLEVLVQLAYETDHYHVDWKLPAGNQTYRMAIRVPEGREASLLPYLRQTLAAVFGLQAQWENQEREVFVLQRTDNQAGPSESTAQQDVAQRLKGQMTLRRQPINKLCHFLTGSLGIIVVDETGLKGKYDFDIPYQSGNQEVTFQALAKSGLKAIKGRRTIPILVVRPESKQQK